MPSKRTGYAPWSLTREAGVQSATVDGTIEVPQYLQPTIDTGFVDVKGNWKGRRSNDEQFIGITKAESIPNSGEVLFPDAPNHPRIDMPGFNDILIAEGHAYEYYGGKKKKFISEIETEKAAKKEDLIDKPAEESDES